MSSGSKPFLPSVVRHLSADNRQSPSAHAKPKRTSMGSPTALIFIVCLLVPSFAHAADIELSGSTFHRERIALPRCPIAFRLIVDSSKLSKEVAYTMQGPHGGRRNGLVRQSRAGSGTSDKVRSTGFAAAGPGRRQKRQGHVKHLSGRQGSRSPARTMKGRLSLPPIWSILAGLR
jgi:hypothetical protein